jgi:hypothetical protein
MENTIETIENPNNQTTNQTNILVQYIYTKNNEKIPLIKWYFLCSQKLFD